MITRIDTDIRAYYFLLVIILLGISSCQEPIDLNLPEDKKLVILSNFSQDTTITLRLGTTSNISGNLTKYPVNADIKLFKNGEQIEQLKYHPNTGQGIPFYTSSHIPSVGDEYSIIGNHDDYPEINSSDIIPSPLKIENIELFSKEVSEHFTTNYTYDISVIINLFEVDENENYFHLKLIDEPNLYYIDDMDTIRQTVLAEDVFFSLSNENINHISLFHEPGILINRKALADLNKIKLDFTIYNLPNPFVKGNLPLQIRKGSSNYYQFHKSVGEQEITSAENGILASPSTIIYNNIENGIGNFSGYSSTIATIKL